MRKHLFIIAWICAFGAPVWAQAPCPQPPNQVTVKVDATTSFDPVSKLHTYRYTVNSDAASRQNVESFSLDFTAPISNITVPRGWSRGMVHNRSTIHWAAILAGPLPTGVADRGQMPPLLSSIKPGTSLSGFSFTSPHPPGPVKFYVNGEAQIGMGTEADAEFGTQNCPDAVGFFLDLAVVGSTLGPVNFIPVQIEIKPPATPPVSINPRSEGETPVAILGTSSFNVSSIDPASLRLGPGAAAPMHDGVHFEDVNGDGIIDLVAQFPTPSIGLRCLDTALFLTGKTTDGTPIQGSEAVRMVGCK